MKPSSVQSLLIGWFGLLVLGIGLVPAQPYYADSISDYWVAVQSNPDSMLQVMQTAQEQSALHSRDRAAVLLIQAYAWFFKDNYSKALQLANHSASISPDVAPGMVEYITIVALQEEHKYHEALAHGHLSVSITGSPHSYLQRSRVYYNLGMYHKALSDVQTAIKNLKQAKPSYLQVAANCFLQMDQNDSALYYYKKAMDAAPLQNEYRVAYMNLLSKNKRYQEVKTVAQTALLLDSANTTILEKLFLSESASLLQINTDNIREQNATGAGTDTNKASKFDSILVVKTLDSLSQYYSAKSTLPYRILWQHGLILRSLQYYQQAKLLLDSALVLQKDEPLLYGRAELELYEQISREKLDPIHAATTNQKGAYNTGRFVDTLAQWLSLIQLDTLTDSNYHLDSSYNYFMQGYLSYRIGAYYTRKEWFPSLDSAMRDSLTTSLFRQSVQLLYKSLQVDSTRVSAINYLGHAYTRLHNTDSAHKYFTKYYYFTPRSPINSLNAVETMFMTEKYEEARAILTEVEDMYLQDRSLFIFYFFKGLEKIILQRDESVYRDALYGDTTITKELLNWNFDLLREWAKSLAARDQDALPIATREKVKRWVVDFEAKLNDELGIVIH